MVDKFCDNCGAHATTPGKIYRLDLGGNSGANLCKKCWNAEMKWRKERNKTLTGKAKFPIKAFPGK